MPLLVVQPGEVRTDIYAYHSDVQQKTWDFQANVVLPRHWYYKDVNSLYEEGAENLHPPKPQLFTY